MKISNNNFTKTFNALSEDTLRKTVEHQIATEFPLMKYFMNEKKLEPKVLDVVRNVRKKYSKEFHFGDRENKIIKVDKTEEARFPVCKSCFCLSFDLSQWLIKNCIFLSNNEDISLNSEEESTLVRLLEEHMESLKEFGHDLMRWLNLEIHRSGTHDTNSVAGLDALVSIKPDVSIVGGINAETANYWRNHTKAEIGEDLTKEMDTIWRGCITGGVTPNFILAGADFIDAYRKNTSSYTKKPAASYGYGVNTDIYFKGVELIFDPQFEELDELEKPRVPWRKRCYFLHTKSLFLNYGLSIETNKLVNDELIVKIIFSRAISMNLRNVHAVLSIA
jgi:hypothetical protein